MVHPVGALLSSIAVLLIIAMGFSVMLGATRLAGRLFLLAIGLLIVLPLAFGLLANVHQQMARASEGAVATKLALLLIVVGACVALWFALWLKGIHALQNWVIPRFGPSVDGEVTGAFLTGWLRSVISLVTILTIVLIVLALILFQR